MSGNKSTDVTDVKHNGYDIRYREDENLWSCHTLDLEARSLKALRQKINEIDAVQRRVDHVKAIKVDRWSGNGRPCVVTLIHDDGECWITEHARGAYKSRSKVSFNDLVLDNEENRAALVVVKAAKAAAERASKHVETLTKALPRVTRAQLLELKVQRADELSHTGDE